MRPTMFVLLFSIVALPFVFAVGYGTSSITLSSGSAVITSNSSLPVTFTVNLATGNTWGTTLNVVNYKQLATEGINISISNPSGDPPYSGTLVATASQSVQNGVYKIVLAATGDDPSTANTTLNLTINRATALPTTTVNGTGQAKTTATTSILPPSATSIQQSPSYGSYPANKISGYAILLAIIILLITAYMVYIMKTKNSKLIIIGIALILIGIAVWLYGDYNGGLMSYVWGGVAAILLGTLIWVYGDYASGAFAHK